MKKLGAYIGETVHGVDIDLVRKNTFVWYEVVVNSSQIGGMNVYEIFIWSLKNGYPNGKKPDARYSTTNPRIDEIVIPIKDAVDKYCIEWEDRNWLIKECKIDYDYYRDYECIATIKADQFGSNNFCHWEWAGERAFSVLKNAKVSPIPIYKRQKLTDDMIKKQLKESLYKSALNSCYGIGGFTTKTDPFTIVKMLPHEEKETKTMEKKTMTETDSFLKNLNGITITSTYSKLHHGISKPYYIYYPEMNITEEMADTLLTVLLMAKREYIHKVVFNPEKGTTTIYRGYGDGSTTVKCRDGEFDYILGYNMARTKMYLGSDDYNWFNKIKNHRKTHIEYTEKKPTKKGGKK